MEFHANKPIYRQISDYACGCILSGAWRPGERVPSVRELAVEMAVNSNTVLKAMEFLQNEGMIYPRRGMGYYLADDARGKVDAMRRREFFAETIPDLRARMEQLGISEADLLAALRASE